MNEERVVEGCGSEAPRKTSPLPVRDLDRRCTYPWSPSLGSVRNGDNGASDAVTRRCNGRRKSQFAILVERGRCCGQGRHDRVWSRWSRRHDRERDLKRTKRLQKKPTDSHPTPAMNFLIVCRLARSSTWMVPSPWQAMNSSLPRKAMSIGWRPVGMAV